MAIIKKTLFAENLDKYNTFVQDTDANSKYFKITELSDTFTGGKNAFLIQGSEYLVADTLIKIELKDASGNTIYHEPGEGIVSSSINGDGFVTEYYEGVSKVVAVYIYPETAYGPCTLTILGELSEYDNNGLRAPVPLNWQGQYNVKWQKQINVNPALANTTKIRFYKRPVATISETLSPIYTIVSGSKVQSNIVSSFANIKLSQIDTFAGDVKRIKVFRTSLGDISDADLIQDILVESKELLTSYELSGSVVGQGGLFTSETLQKLWTPIGVTAELTSSRIDNGVKLSGSGYFKYTSSLNLSDGNVFELGIDAFYSSSVASNLGIYISGSNNGEYLVSTLNGIAPTKNLKDQTIQFTLPFTEPTASLYLSQSRGEWHVGNINLKLSQDTAFSPSEVEFVTSMPTVIGNETYKFNFEFYDVNNNYVPVAVTQSALFTGGNNNIGGTLIFISSSASSSLDALNKVSSSISGTMTVYSSSASSSITTLSGSVSGSITSLSGSVSGSITSLSSSVSASITSLSSSVSQSNAIILSSSFAQVKNLADGNYSGSFIGDTTIYSPAIGGQVGYIKEKFTVGDTTAAQINLDATTSTRRIYIGTGTYNNANTSVYLDSAGKFSLKDKLTWDGTTLGVNGTINVTGGNAATDANALLYSQRAAASASISASAAQSNAATDATTKANAAYNNATAQLQSLADGGYSGSFIGSTTIYSPNIGGQNGYISNILKVGQNGITLDGGNKKIYVGTGTYKNANTPFYFASGSTDVFSLGDKLSWDGSTLGITGEIVITAGSTKTAIDAAAAAAATADGKAVTADGKAVTAQNTANGKITAGGAASDVNSNTTTISGGKIRTGIIESTGYAYTSGDYSTAGSQINLDNGLIRSKNFTITSAGDALFKGTVSGATIIGGTIQGGAISGGSIAIGSNFSVNSAGTLTAVNANLSGTVTATAGNIGGFTIANNTLAAAGNLMKIDTQAPAILLYQTNGGSPKIEVNAKNTLTSPSAAGIYPSWPSNNGMTGTDGARTATSTGTTVVTDYLGQPSDAFSITEAGLLNFSMYTPDLSIAINGGTTTKIYGYSAYPPYSPSYPYQSYNSVQLSTRSASAGFILQLLDGSNNVVYESGDIGPRLYATGGYYYSYYEADSSGNFWNSNSYQGNGNTSSPLVFTNRQSTINVGAAGTYKARFVIRVYTAAGYVNDYTNNAITYSSTTSTVTQNTGTGGISMNFAPNLNKVEITNAGIQIITTQDSYLEMARAEAGTWAGGYLLRLVGGKQVIQAYGGYPTYLANTGLDIYGGINVTGLGNTIGYTIYDSNNSSPYPSSAYTVLTINGRYTSTQSMKARVDCMADIIPYSDDVFNLGGSSYRWRDIYTNGNVTTTSDRTKKFDIQSSSLGLDFINKLEPVSYRFVTGSIIYEEPSGSQYTGSATTNLYDENGYITTGSLQQHDVLEKQPIPNVKEVIPGNRRHYGLIAQDVKDVLDDMDISTNDFGGYVAGDIENDTQLGLRYDQFIAPMIKAIQQLSTKIEELEAKISGSV